MDTVTVSPKFQVVIPRRVRELLGVQPGQKVKVILYDNRIEMIPLRPVQDLRETWRRWAMRSTVTSCATSSMR
jgi:AbrB family looped-hinge helix DNA binding protein